MKTNHHHGASPFSHTSSHQKSPIDHRPSNIDSNFFSLEKLISDAIIVYKTRCLEKGIVLQVLDDLVTYVTLIGDPDKLTRLLDMILNNAVENTNASTIIFSARPLLWSQHEILLEFVVEDNGPEKRSKGFAFYRSMVHAKKLITDLNGKSELINVTGGNTTFKFIIKCQRKDEVEKINENDQYKDSLKGKRILVAEDNEINQQMIVNILRREGVIVDIASDGKEAVDIFERHDHHHLVIMDLQMPFMDGFQATNYIRKKLKSTIPVIAVSAGANSLEQSQCYELGFDQYISKPFTPSELITELRRFLLDNYNEDPSYNKIAV